MTSDVTPRPTDVVEPPDLAPGSATKETLEDYTLRFAPRHYRSWSTGVVAVSALGGIAYLADFAIGANIGISYGTTNALWGIAVFAVVIFLTGFPVAYYAARYNLDLDLITRGSGFGYYGSVVSNVIFATFTFIFFALEGSIMAQGLQLGLGVPLWAGYAVSTLIIFPLVIYGMKVLTKSGSFITVVFTSPDGGQSSIDVYTCFYVGEHLHETATVRQVVPRSAILPLRELEFEGRLLPAPADPDTMLAVSYGPGWRVPDPSFKHEPGPEVT